MKNNFKNENVDEILNNSNIPKEDNVNFDSKDIVDVNSIDSSLSCESENNFSISKINDVNFLKEKIQSQESDIKYLKNRLKNYDMTVSEVTRLNIEINKLNKIIINKNETIRQFQEILDLSKQKFQILLKNYNSCLEKLKNLKKEKNNFELKPCITIPQKNDEKNNAINNQYIKNNENMVNNYFKLTDNNLNTKCVKNTNYKSNNLDSVRNFNENRFQGRCLTPINSTLNNRFKCIYRNKNNNEKNNYKFKQLQTVGIKSLRENDLKYNRGKLNQNSNEALDYSFHLLDNLKRNITENNYSYLNI